jgi:hypothetical protein
MGKVRVKVLRILGGAGLKRKGDCGRLWFDIETYKEPVKAADRPKDWPTNRGVPLKNRMKPFMICVSYCDTNGDLVFRVADSEDEKALLRWFAGIIEGSYELAYCSHNDFDKHVLLGTWTTARRKRLEKSGPWPNILDYEKEVGGLYGWVNVWRNMRDFGTLDFERGEEIAGADIAWGGKNASDKEIDLIGVHCLRDVAGAMLEDGDYRFKREVEGWLCDLFIEDIEWDETKTLNV